jgi:tRNA threonylcarbamoyladenosine biosynthesis protein TsaE
MVEQLGLEREVVTRSSEETRGLAARLAAVAEAGDVIALIGDLGAGKTQFAAGFGAGLGVPDPMTSPTFVLMAEHAGRLPVFHLDCYRLAGPADALGGGLLDERQAAGVTLIEWADRLGPLLPSERLDVRLSGTGDAPRTIRIVARSATFRRYLDGAR